MCSHSFRGRWMRVAHSAAARRRMHSTIRLLASRQESCILAWRSVDNISKVPCSNQVLNENQTRCGSLDCVTYICSRLYREPPQLTFGVRNRPCHCHHRHCRRNQPAAPCRPMPATKRSCVRRRKTILPATSRPPPVAAVERFPSRGMGTQPSRRSASAITRPKWTSRLKASVLGGKGMSCLLIVHTPCSHPPRTAACQVACADRRRADEFGELIGSSEVEGLEPDAWDGRNNYKDVRDAVSAAAGGTGSLRVYREQAGSRVTYYVVGLDRVGCRVVGVRVKAVES